MKTEKAVECIDREEIERVMADLAAHEREIDRIELEMNEEIARLKAEADELAKEHLAAAEKCTATLKMAAKIGRQELFGEGKTLRLTHGEISFRSSTAVALVNKKASWDNVLAGLTEDGRLDAVRVTREVNKDVLKTWTAAALARYDVKIRTTETIHIKPDVEKIQ